MLSFIFHPERNVTIKAIIDRQVQYFVCHRQSFVSIVISVPSGDCAASIPLRFIPGSLFNLLHTAAITP